MTAAPGNDNLHTARWHLLRLLERWTRARQEVERRLARPSVDAASLLHWLGQPQCVTALKSANEYLAAARVQMDSIESASRAWEVGVDRARVFHEIHYYFICWDAIWKRLHVLKAQSGFGSLKLILKKYRTTAEHYAIGRDQLEHYDEWLAGRPKLPPLAEWDHGNLQGTTYSLAGRRWDISRASLSQLESLLREVNDAMKIEGRARLIAQEMRVGDATRAGMTFTGAGAVAAAKALFGWERRKPA